MANSPRVILLTLFWKGGRIFFVVCVGKISKGIWLLFSVLKSLLILDLLVQLYFVFMFLTFLILIRGHFLYFQTESFDRVNNFLVFFYFKNEYTAKNSGKKK